MGIDAEGGMDWDPNDMTTFDTDNDSYNAFSFNHSADSPAIDDVYAFGGHGDHFMETHFDLSNTSDSLMSGGAADMASPGMPVIETDSPKVAKAQGQTKTTKRGKRATVCYEWKVPSWCVFWG